MKESVSQENLKEIQKEEKIKNESEKSIKKNFNIYLIFLFNAKNYIKRKFIYNYSLKNVFSIFRNRAKCGKKRLGNS